MVPHLRCLCRLICHLLRGLSAKCFVDVSRRRLLVAILLNLKLVSTGLYSCSDSIKTVLTNEIVTLSFKANVVSSNPAQARCARYNIM
jgi:hypothetical protein